MSSSTSNRSAREHCRHTEFRIGCTSCTAYYTALERNAALVQVNRLEGEVAVAEALIEESADSASELQALEARRDVLRQRHEARKKRHEWLVSETERTEEALNSMITGEHHGLSDAELLEADAAEREAGLERIWARGAQDGSSGKFTKLQREDPALDSLVTAPDRGEVLPTWALGGQTSSADMSYGAAIAAFGPPKFEGQSQKPEEEEPEEVEQLSSVEAGPSTKVKVGQLDALDALEASISDCTLVADMQDPAAGSVVPESPTTTSIASKNPSVATNAAPEPAGMASVHGGRPAFGNHPFTGLAGWPDANTWIDHESGSASFPVLTARSEKRQIILAALEAWTPPDDFDDGSQHHGHPSTYWPYEESLGEIDRKELDDDDIDDV